MVLARALALISALAGFSPLPLQAAAPAEIVFLQLNDLHANLNAHNSLVRKIDAQGRVFTTLESRGGLARIATAVFEQRRRNSNTVLMNIGDTFHGGVEALYTRGNAIVEPLNALNIDVGVPGNWDFAYGPAVTRLRFNDSDSFLYNTINKLLYDDAVKKPNYPSLAANVYERFLWQNERLLPATMIKKVGTSNIGFIGLSSNIVPFMSPIFSRSLDFLQGEAAYTDLLNKLSRRLRQEGAELVVVMSELGLHQNYQLANNIDPGIDVIFSAHTHEVTQVPLQSRSGALVVESGDDTFLGKMTVSIASNGQRTFDWQLIDIDDNIPEDAKVRRLIDKARAPFLADAVNFKHFVPNHDQPLLEPIDTVIARTPALLHRRHALNNPINNLLADAIRNYYQPDIALSPGFRFDSVIQKGGDITLEHLYRIDPSPAILAMGEIRAHDLRAIFEVELERIYSEDAFKHRGGWFFGISGMTLTVNLNQPAGSRVIEMRDSDDGHLIQDNEVLSVVACQRPLDDSATLCRHGGFLNTKKLPGVNGNTWTAMQLLRKVLETQRPLQIDESTRVIDQSPTPMWPQSDLIQAIR